MSSEAAVRANATRRVDADIEILRQHFDGIPKCEVRKSIEDFLVRWTPDGGTVGDLLGPGYSSLLLAARGLRVVAAEDCSWSKTKLGNDRQRAEAAAHRLGTRVGVEVVIGSFRSIIPRLTTANYDPCSTPVGPVRDDVRAMAAARLVAFAVTVVLSRVAGMGGREPDQYELLTEALLGRDAPGYEIVQSLKYRGSANVPMGTYFLVRRKTLDDAHRAEMAAAYERADADRRKRREEYEAWRSGLGTVKERWRDDHRRAVRGYYESGGVAWVTHAKGNGCGCPVSEEEREADLIRYRQTFGTLAPVADGELWEIARRLRLNASYRLPHPRPKGGGWDRKGEQV